MANRGHNERPDERERRRLTEDYNRALERDSTHAQTGLDAPNFRRDNYAWYDPPYYDWWDEEANVHNRSRSQPIYQQSDREQYEWGRDYDWDDRYNANWGYNNWVQGPYAGIGPQGYRRPDVRIWEDVNERLAEHPRLDASEMLVEVQDGEVTLDGTVSSRRDKRLAEDLADSVPGVQDVHNHLHIRGRQPGDTNK